MQKRAVIQQNHVTWPFSILHEATVQDPPLIPHRSLTILSALALESTGMVEITLFTIDHREIESVCIGEYFRLDRV
jgi:hypothetical protein